MKNQYILLAIFSFVIAFVLLPFSRFELPVYADGIGNTLVFMGYGSFKNGFSMTAIDSPRAVSQTAVWNYNSMTDYLAFRDSTTVAGFNMKLFMTSSEMGDFVYTGESVSQTAIDVSYFKIFADYFSSTGVSSTYVAASAGVDDPTKPLNILSGGTCGDSQVLSNYEFNASLLDLESDYGLTMSSTAQVYISSSAVCEVEGQIDIRRMELLYPPSSNSGSYDSTLMIVILDGH